VFFVASTVGEPADVLFADEVAPPELGTDLDARAHGFYWTEGIRGLGWAIDAIPTLKNGSTVGIASPPAIMLPDGTVVKPDLRDAERLQGFPSDWTAPAGEVTRPSFRWSLAGNAVSVPVIEWLGERLKAPGRFDPGRTRDFASGKAWPRAARFDGRGRSAVEINAFPVWRDRLPLHRFLDHPGTLLSARATAGFLSRARTAKLRFPDGFLDRLQLHLIRMQAFDQASNGGEFRATPFERAA
jgi:DNA (cytosine-5)-methyltransferase 1